MSGSGTAMALMKFIKARIELAMESSSDRDRVWEQHLRSVTAAAASAKANMQHPTKMWGFWRGEKHTGKYELESDPAVGKMPGRRKVDLS